MPRPNLSGTWDLDLERSRLEGPAPSASTFEIVHREPSFELTRTHIFGGTRDVATFAFTSDGTEHRHRIGDLDSTSTLTWDGETLVLTMRLEQGEMRGTNTVRYRLQDDGRTLVADEVLQSPAAIHDNHWVFCRRS